jgi:hypothetical protein
MKMRGVACGIVIILCLTIFNSGCISDENESGSNTFAAAEYKVGDTWTLKFSSEDGEPFTMTYTISDVSFLYEGQKVMVHSVNYYMEGFGGEEGEAIFEDINGNGTAYTTVRNELLYTELVMTSRAKENPNDNWNDVRVERKSNFEYVGSPPEKATIGDIWTIIETEEYEQQMYMNGLRTSYEKFNETRTKIYKILGEKTVNVEAGTFDCFEIRSDEVEEDIYSFMYYSPKAKSYVMQLEYLGTNQTNMMEMISYNVS